jgi:hypothetical protein
MTYDRKWKKPRYIIIDIDKCDGYYPNKHDVIGKIFIAKNIDIKDERKGIYGGRFRDIKDKRDYFFYAVKMVKGFSRKELFLELI